MGMHKTIKGYGGILPTFFYSNCQVPKLKTDGPSSLYILCINEGVIATPIYNPENTS